MASSVIRSAFQSVRTRVAPIVSQRVVQPNRGMVTQPLAMGNPYYEEEQMRERMTMFHIEAMEVWREEAKNLASLMLNDDIAKNEILPSTVNQIASEQVQSLFEELIEDDLLDPRLGWTASYDNY